MSELKQEWMVVDQRGGFAMGTPQGLRMRKYHGFYQSVPSRAEKCFLADLEMVADGEQLWPHSYQGSAGDQVVYPVHAGGYEFTDQPRPTWTWRLSQGTLSFRVDANPSGGLALLWAWKPSTRNKGLNLKIRPFFAMRDLHGLGGQTWNWESLTGEPALARIQSPDGSEVFCRIEGGSLGDSGLTFQSAPSWYYRFYYPEEVARGYDSTEDLFSAGIWEMSFKGQGSCSVRLSVDPEDLKTPFKPTTAQKRTPVMDFALLKPAGIVAGFPWFGEWGRDTFIALPGMVAAWLRSGGQPSQVWAWSEEILARWGELIHTKGILPNLFETDGTHQWESADATLWWTHSLAALWQLSLNSASGFPVLGKVRERFSGLLAEAIDSIASGRHLFLKVSEGGDGLLEVSGGHTTWMDARVHGHAVTPRVGKLPEINALWFQAQCLNALWNHPESLDSTWLQDLAKAALKCPEQDRPNRIFLHSLPLAPSFVIGDQETLQADLAWMSEKLVTPVGLRTLSPDQKTYLSSCCGTQAERDTAYHRGPVWGWLGGHYQMAASRLKSKGLPASHSSHSGHSAQALIALGDSIFSAKTLAEMPISGHIPELFDASAPYAYRGTPAQAWSLACLEEADARKRLKLDTRLLQEAQSVLRTSPKVSAQEKSQTARRSPDVPL